MIKALLVLLVVLAPGLGLHAALAMAGLAAATCFPCSRGRHGVLRVACKNAGVVGERGASRPAPIDPHPLRPMHFPSLALAAFVGWTASTPALAQSSSVEHDALLYLDSQVLPKKAAACSARISGFSARFEPAFRTWLAANRSRIAAGETFLRADAEKTRMPLERDVESVVSSITKQWNAAPLPDLQENCDNMLTQLREGPDGE